jgi:hypothetical protein
MAFTKMDTPFVWFTASERSFERLKKSFISAPILCHFDLKRKVMVEIDVSNIIVVGVLSQYDNYVILYPVAYFSRKHSPAEINNEIYHKELLTIIQGYKEYCPLLEGFPPNIKVISDHGNLTYFITNHLLNYHCI